MNKQSKQANAKISCGISLKASQEIEDNRQDNKCNKGYDNRPWETRKESNQRWMAKMGHNSNNFGEIQTNFISMLFANLN